MKRYTKEQIILAFNHEKLLAIQMRLAFSQVKTELAEIVRNMKAKEEQS